MTNQELIEGLRRQLDLLDEDRVYHRDKVKVLQQELIIMTKDRDAWKSLYSEGGDSY